MGSWVLGSGFWVLGSWVLGSGFRVLGSGFMGSGFKALRYSLGLINLYTACH
jgi:hypothetical protein